MAIFIVEGYFRLFNPYSALGAGTELEWMRLDIETFSFDLTKIFTVDPDFGFRPILGNEFYNIYGTKINNYKIDKKPGIRRLLFMGDSVIDHGKFIRALKDVYGEEKFEYWNAGVGSFNPSIALRG